MEEANIQRDGSSTTGEKTNVSAPETPKMTIVGWEDKSEGEVEKAKALTSSGFKSKEQVLVTCSCRISLRLIFFWKNCFFFFVLILF